MPFTNADALPFELAAVVDAERNEYRPPEHPDEARAAYVRAWREQRARAGRDPKATAALIVGALMVRR